MHFETRHHRQRRERLAAGFQPEWRELLSRRMPAWTQLDDDERARLEFLTVNVLADLRWEAAHGFELDDDICVTIAAEASLLLLGLPLDGFPGVKSVVVHPHTVVMKGEHSQVKGVVSDGPYEILGQADAHGPVLIVWDAVLSAARHPGSGHNVVYHEFAHRLDMLDGTADGTPPMESVEQSEQWVRVCTAVYEQVATGRGSPVLRSYAGVNPAEFFAVATEAFFDEPVGLRRSHPDLYEVLSGYYGQDPAARWR